MDKVNYPPTSEGLADVLRRLRAPDGCPWDRKQTRESLSRHLAGETAELLDAIDRNDPADICDELGDVLMNIFLQILVAEEKGEFGFEEVWKNIIGKMIRRHVHIFGDAKAETPEEVTKLWLEVKKQERAANAAPERHLGGVKHTLSALERAEKLQKKAAEVGFDWQNESQVAEKITEEAVEVVSALKENSDDRINEELGDLLFAAVNLIRFRDKGTAEELLRAANRKFERRFNYIEDKLAEEGIPLADAGLEKMDSLWNQCKECEAKEFK